MAHQKLHNNLQMKQVINKGIAVNEAVVKKYQDKTLKERFEDIVHESLKCRGGVSKPKGHYKKFVMTLVSAEGCLGDVFRAHLNMVITRTQV